MSYWPEKETAWQFVNLEIKTYECVSVFGFDSLFDLKLSHNTKRTKGLYLTSSKIKAVLTIGLS